MTAKKRRAAASQIDAGVLKNLVELYGAEDTRQLIELFVKDSRKQVAEMKEALAKGRADAVGFAAHTLKSASATLGAMALAEACAKLEQTSKGGSIAKLAGLVEKVAEHVDAARSELEAVPKD